MARTLTKREKILLTLTGTLAAAYFFYRFVFFPQWETYLITKEELAAGTQRLQSIKAINLKLQGFAKENEKLTRKLELLKQANPGDQGTLLLRLDDVAFAKGLELKLYKPTGAVQGILPSQTAEVEIAGPYTNIADFFKFFETAPYVTKIRIHKMVPVLIEEPDDPFTGDLFNENIRVSFSIRVFHMPLESPVFEVAKPAVKKKSKPKAKITNKLPASQNTSPFTPKPDLSDPSNQNTSTGEVYNQNP